MPLGSGQGHLTETAARMKHDVNEYVIPTCCVCERLVTEVLKHVGSALHRRSEALMPVAYTGHGRLGIIDEFEVLADVDERWGRVHADVQQPVA